MDLSPYMPSVLSVLALAGLVAAGIWWSVLFRAYRTTK